VTVSGLFASWYFMSGSVGMPPNPTLGSLKRAITTSFGSICLGSMIVAIIQTLRALIRTIRSNNNNIFTLIADCFLGCLDRLVQYFNHYAFVQVAIYGKTFFKAAKSTWNLFQDAGVEAIINDNLIGGVLTTGCLLGAILTGAVGALLGTYWLPNSGDNMWIILFFLGLFIGYLMMVLSLQVVDSGIATLFVAFAEDREVLRRNNPQLYEKFRSTYNLPF